MGVSLNGGTPISHPKMISFSRKKPWLLGKPTILGNPLLTPLVCCIIIDSLHPPPNPSRMRPRSTPPMWRWSGKLPSGGFGDPRGERQLYHRMVLGSLLVVNQPPFQMSCDFWVMCRWVFFVLADLSLDAIYVGWLFVFWWHDLVPTLAKQKRRWYHGDQLYATGL